MNNTETKLSEDELKTLFELQDKLYQLDFQISIINMDLSEGKDLPDNFLDTFGILNRFKNDLNESAKKCNMELREYLNYTYSEETFEYLENGVYLFVPYDTFENLLENFREILVKSRISEALKLLISKDQNLVNTITEMESRVKERLERKVKIMEEIEKEKEDESI